MAELLLELFSEEIPARMQKRASEDLKKLVTDGLKEASLEFSTAEAYVTPRRLALVVDGLPDRQPDVSEEKRGPRTDAPDKAVQGFLRGNGLTLEQCEKRTTDKGEFWYAVTESKGRATAQVLPGVLGDAVSALHWQKSMRWGTGTMRWVRSLQRLLCLFDGTVLDLTIGDGIAAGNLTSGHRFHAGDAFEVTDFADYVKKLRAAHVILDAAERRDIIATGAAKLAQAEGFTVQDDPALLDEVSGLVEWPVPLIGAIDSAFMEVPGEVLTSAMRNHQKYFSLENADGSLAPRFVVVANLDAPDGGAQITAGNERVLRARLSDARFFWDNDRKIRLEERVPELDKIVFHARLGTLGEKITRVQTLAAELSEFIPGCDRDLARSAALLAKADLVTEMVAEFPELQGVMGRYYALGEGEKPEVADAIAEHYAPQGPNDTCPTAPVSVAVALADKIDTLVGFWAIGETPTGSRDPFALRRAALGVIRLVLENGLRMKLRPVFDLAWHGGADSKGDALDALLEFFADRLKVYLREQGVRHDLINAVFALGDEDDLVRLLARVEALAAFAASEDGANLLTAFKRATNIVQIEEKKDKTSHGGDVRADLLVQDEEKALSENLTAFSGHAATALAAEDFGGVMTEMAGLRPTVDAFFDQVTVNSDDADQRANRLRLLSRIRATMGQIADFTLIEG
jgi:glycyl-tRNA synthetase beta chain